MRVSIKQLSSEKDYALYAEWIANHPEGNLWQSLQWKRYQEALGKEVRIYIEEESADIVASALVVIDTTTGGYSTWEVPRGPLTNGKLRMENGQLFDFIIDKARKERCVCLYISPISKFSIINSCPEHSRRDQLSIAKRHVHPQATRIIDLTQSEEDILKQMKPKGRYNIKVAQKHGVTIERSTDIDAYHALAVETAQNQGLATPSKAKYEHFLQDIEGSSLFLAYKEPSPGSRLRSFGASDGQAGSGPESRQLVGPGPGPGPEKEPIAGALSLTWGNQGIYYYGASKSAHRATMAPYLLQWEMMRYFKAQECVSYDLLGVAPKQKIQDTRYKTHSPSRDPHPWEGITSFKEKFGGEYIEYPAEQEVRLRPMIHCLICVKRRLLG